MKTRLFFFSEEWGRKESFDWQTLVAILCGSLVVWPLALKLPALGWDWHTYFHARKFIGGYPPWLGYILAFPINLPARVGFGLIISVTMVTVAMATAREARSYSRVSQLGAALMALLSPPVLMLLWEGNIDGLVLLGIVALPWGVPLVLLKPFVAGWAVLARRTWLLWSAGFAILTLLIWGLWPIQMIGVFITDYEHPMAMGWHNLGWPIVLVGLLLVMKTNPDTLRLAAAGSFLAPYLMPYHFLVLLPAIGRAIGWKRWLLWGWAWTLILVPAFAGYSRYLGMGFPLAVWWLLKDADSK